MEGYVKTFRKMLDWEWYTEANTMRLFTHCLLKANYEEKKWKGIVVPVGSFITSSEKLAKELHLTRNQIRYAICNLKSTNEITTKATNKNTQIIVVNWALYQCNGLENHQQNDQQINNVITNESPTSHQQITTTKELKNLKKERIEEVSTKNIGDSALPSVSKPIKIDFFKEFSAGDENLYNTLLAFNDMRNKMRKPMTDHAKDLFCRKLAELKVKGNDIIACIEQSTANSWTDVYEVKEEYQKKGTYNHISKNELDPNEKVHGVVLR